MDTAKHLAISAVGLATPEALHLATPATASNAEFIIKMIVQIAVGLVTIFTLIKRPKKTA